MQPPTGRMWPAPAGYYRFVEHGGEVEIELDAETEPEVFGATLAAFAALVKLDAEVEAAHHKITLSAEDHALLLVDWLSELIFLAETEDFVPERLVTVELTGTRCGRRWRAGGSGEAPGEGGHAERSGAGRPRAQSRAARAHRRR